MAEFDNFFKSAFSVDPVIFGFDDSDLKVLLIKRGTAPFKDKWALPGDLVYPNEDLDSAAIRVLEELTGMRNVYLEQVQTFGSVNRHPLGRVITVAYYSLVKIKDYNLHAASFAAKAQWHSVSGVSDLAFDHFEILQACFQRLKKRVRGEPVGFELLPQKFTLTELQNLYESILEAKLDKRNFRKKILSMQFLVNLQEVQSNVAHRPAMLYSFDEAAYHKLTSEGVLSFGI